tara:strand:- start:1737 stop:1961 length:225 start_codon:yes stop_codon:yes gene_type:complete
LDLLGAVADWDHQQEEDYFSQPGGLLCLMGQVPYQTLFDKTARLLAGVPIFIQKTDIEHCIKADPAYGEGYQWH